MGQEKGLFKEDIFNEENLKYGIAVLRKILTNYPAIHTLNYQYANTTLTESEIVGKNKSIDLNTMVDWGIINKVAKDSYQLNTSKILVLEALILLLKS